jgi:hypothetical protein
LTENRSPSRPAIRLVEDHFARAEAVNAQLTDQLIHLLAGQSVELDPAWRRQQRLNSCLRAGPQDGDDLERQLLPDSHADNVLEDIDMKVRVVKHYDGRICRNEVVDQVLPRAPLDDVYVTVQLSYQAALADAWKTHEACVACRFRGRLQLMELVHSSDQRRLVGGADGSG